MTNIFISWSGETSKQLAEALHSWIPSTLQFTKPYFTPNDVEKGAKWSSDISQRLAETHIGIICLTRENFSRPWILFEAGALSKDLEKSRLCSILFGMENTDLSGPLTTFQSTQFEQSDFKKLMKTINDAGGESKLSPATFETVFEMWWPKLEEQVKAILRESTNTKQEELRSDRDMLEEILTLSRVNSTREIRRGVPIPEKLVAELLDVVESTCENAVQNSSDELLNNAKSTLRAVDYLNRRTMESSEAADRITRLRKTLESSETQIAENRKMKGFSIDDDEIPF